MPKFIQIDTNTFINPRHIVAARFFPATGSLRIYMNTTIEDQHGGTTEVCYSVRAEEADALHEYLINQSTTPKLLNNPPVPF